MYLHNTLTTTIKDFRLRKTRCKIPSHNKTFYASSFSPSCSAVDALLSKINKAPSLAVLKTKGRCVSLGN